MKYDNLRDILQAIKNQEIEIGINKQYCFVLDEDGELVFLQRDPNEKDVDEDGEPRLQWPYNKYDGIILYQTHTFKERGLAIVEEFLEALDIDFLS